MVSFVKERKIPFSNFGAWVLIHELAGWLASWEYGNKKVLMGRDRETL